MKAFNTKGKDNKSPIACDILRKAEEWFLKWSSDRVTVTIEDNKYERVFRAVPTSSNAASVILRVGYSCETFDLSVGSSIEVTDLPCISEPIFDLLDAISKGHVKETITDTGVSLAEFTLANGTPWTWKRGAAPGCLLGLFTRNKPVKILTYEPW